MAILVKASVLSLLLCMLSSIAFGLECYCDQSVGTNPQCGGFNQFGSSCDGSSGVCYTSHVITPHQGLLVFAGCLDNATNPAVGEMCSGAQNSETLVHQCCHTPMCNQGFFNNNPFPTVPPTTSSPTDNVSSGSSTEAVTDGNAGSTAVTPATAEVVMTIDGNGAGTTHDESDLKEAVIVAISVSVSIVFLVVISMALLLIITTHQRWTCPHHSKDAGEESSETELKPSVPPLHILKSQQPSTTQVHPQIPHKSAVVVMAGQTLMPAMDGVICWDSDGKGS